MLSDEILERLDIVPLDALKIHEQTVPANLNALRETMLNLGKLVDPLIIDNKHKIVLDGNHRRQVLELLKVENAIVQPVDYMGPDIRIGGWHIAAKDLDFNKIEGEKTDLQAGFSSLQNLSSCLMAISKKGAEKQAKLITCPSKGLPSVFCEQEKFLKSTLGIDNLMEKNSSLVFVEDSRLDYFLNSGYTVFARKIFSKEEIIKEALAGRPLPPKSTRHMIPNRIIRLNFRLGYLNETTDQAHMLLSEMVKKRVKYGSARYYTEPVIVLY
ncbi:MAG: hypothetical protein V1822_04315 [Candidatus Micrarchaeota archaeon]